MKNSMSDGIEPLRKKYVVYPEERAHLREGVSGADAGFLERVFHSAAQSIVGVGHRIVVEIACHDGFHGAGFDIPHDIIHLFRTSDYRFAHLLLGIFHRLPIVAFQ